MSKKGIPGEKFEYKQAAKCRIQHRSMLKAWSGCIPLSGNSQKKKNGPITCEQLGRASTLHHSAHHVHSHPSSQRLYKRLTVDPQWTATSCDRLISSRSRRSLRSLRSLLLLAGSLQLHVDLTFRLRFGIRKSMHQLEAMPLVEFDGPRQGGQADAVNLRKALGLCDQRFQQQTTEAHAAMFLRNSQLRNDQSIPLWLDAKNNESHHLNLLIPLSHGNMQAPAASF
mmetsp:Transcript_40432/g.66798  ORF Transcript_40432/g.66798 Transcript_40432/m.66798 type:complete len:226 (+) Transcript_40432:83-760(+)